MVVGWRCEGVSLGYGRPVLRGVDLEIGGGEVVAIVGPNGAGKSTLLRALLGILRPIAGEICVGGRPLAGLEPSARAKIVGGVLGKPGVEFGYTVREHVRFGRFPHLHGGWGRWTAKDEAAVGEALARMELEALAERPLPELSEGQQQRVSVARLLCQGVAHWVLDEPTSHQDPYHALKIGALLRAEARAGKAVVAVMHDLNLAMQVPDRVALIAEGGLVAVGAPEEVLSPARIRHIWQVESQQVRLEAGVGLVIDSGLGTKTPEL